MKTRKYFEAHKSRTIFIWGIFFQRYFQRRASITPVKMPWTPIDDLTLDDQVAKMIGPIPPSPFSHRKIEIRKLQVAGYNGFKKNIQEEFNVEFKSDYQIGNGRFGKVYRGTSLDNSTVFAFKGKPTLMKHPYTV